MTAPERIVVNRQYVDPEGQSSVPFWHEDKGEKLDTPHRGYRVPPTRYVRADLYDAAVAERDEARAALKRAEAERDAARAEVERLRPVVNAAVEYKLAWDDTRAATEAWMRTGIPHVEGRDLEDAEKTLYQAVTAYLAAKEKTP